MAILKPLAVLSGRVQEIAAADAIECYHGIPAGSVSAPGLYVVGDANTGICSPAADQLAVALGGAQRALFASTFIGGYFDDPSAGHIFAYNANAGTGAFAALQAISDGATIRLGANSAAYTAIGGYKQDGVFLDALSTASGGLSIINQHASSPIRFYTGGYLDANHRVEITAGGNVLIGTTSDANNRRLNVIFDGTATNGLMVNDTAAGGTPELLGVYKNGSAKFVVSYDGTVLANGNTVWTSGNDGAGSGLDADLLDGQSSAYYLPASSYTAADVLAKLLTVDGAGSGLDADLLDGVQGASYLSSKTGIADTDLDATTARGMYVVTYTGFSKLLLVMDEGGSTGPFQLEKHYSNNGLRWRSKTDSTTWSSWEYAVTTTALQNNISGTIWHSGNDGAGSGLDADTLDGLNSDAFVSTTGVATLTNKTIALGSNTISGTKAEFNAACTDGDFVYTSDYTAADVLAKLLTVDGAGSNLDADLLDGRQGTNYAWDTLGTQSAETLRNVHDVGLYTYNVNNASLGDSTPVSYWSVLGWGNGTNGTGQLAANWVSSGNELYFRSLRDTIDNWWTWKKIWHEGNDGAGSGLDADTLDGLNSDAFVSTTGVATLTNKTIALGSNTISGTLAQFNAACTDADFATGGGTATGTNTGDQTSIVGISGTKAQFNTACSDGDFAFLGQANTFTGTITVNDAAGTNAVYSESGIDRNSASTETFNIQNSGAGVMDLQVDGVSVITRTGTYAGYRLKGIVTYTSGSGTYTVPTNVRALRVIVIGAGGGGGGAKATTTDLSVALSSGGGAGAYCKKFYTSLAASYTYTVGAAGTGGGGAGPSNGNTGGSSSFDSLAQIAYGGIGGSAQLATTGVVVINNHPGFGVNAGAGASGGDINTNGGVAREADETGISSVPYILAFGAPSPFGGSAGTNVGSSATTVTGINGLGPGAGGGGAFALRSASTDRNAAGGNGAAGIVIIEEYY